MPGDRKTVSLLTLLRQCCGSCLVSCLSNQKAEGHLRDRDVSPSDGLWAGAA